MTKDKILVVEDEKDILELVIYNLSKAGYQVRGLCSGEEAMRVIPDFLPDLIVLDWMLPGIEGIEICKFVKQNPRLSETSVIMLTAKQDEADIVTGLELGADDYMTKPFSPRVLTARVKAQLRRVAKSDQDDEKVLEVEGLVIHPGKREVRYGEERVKLTNMEFRILHFLASHQGWVYTRAQIVAAVRGEDYAVTDRSVDAIIVGLRKKLGEQGEWVETVRGVGYRFKE